MLFKTDENLHQEVADLLQQHGHDAMSVFDQGMRGFPDDEVAAVCRRERRVLITVDLDFANILTFPPANYSGIIVLRLHEPNRSSVVRAIRRLLPMLQKESLEGQLWTVDDVGMRIRSGI